jgi:GAF domain-containing protein
MAGQVDLISTLTTLSEIGDSINRLGMGHNLQKTLSLIAAAAVRAVAAGTSRQDVTIDTIDNEAAASAVIWIYDQAREEFDPDSRVSAGEPEGASLDDYPRQVGIGRQAIRQRRRLLSFDSDVPEIHPLKQEAGARSIVCYPLIVSEEIVGVLYVYLCQERRFSEVELLIMDNFVHLAGMAIHYGRQVGGLNRALARKVREMEKLKRAASLISSRTNLDDTLQEILSIGLDMTAAQYGSFEMYDKGRDRLVSKALAGSKGHPADEPSLPVGETSVVGWVAARRSSLLIADVQAEEWRAIYQPLPFDREMRSELAVPLIGAGGALEGVLNIESPQPDVFREDDRQLLEALATQAVIAIQEIRLLDAMQEIVQLLLNSDLNELLKLVTQRACDLINVAAGDLWLVSDQETLVLCQSTEDQQLGTQTQLGPSLSGQAIRLGQPITIDDLRTHPDFLDQDLAIKEGWISAIIVPLLSPLNGSQPVGSISLYSDRLRDFSAWDKKLLTCLADHAAVAIRDAEQLDRLKETQEQRAIAETFAAVGDVGANLLHQLNNKFGTISVRVQGIEDKCAPALAAWPYLADNLSDIAQSTEQAMTIVRDSMAQLRPARPQPVDVQPCITRALKRSEPGAAVRISLDGLADLPRVWAGEKQLELVFHNLIENALFAMAGQGQLQILGIWTGDEVTVTIADTGPGIPGEAQAQIFEFPSSLVQGDRRRAGRLGFGLWWVRTFVNRFGGRVSVESEVGCGSSFAVTLPAEREM